MEDQEFDDKPEVEEDHSDTGTDIAEEVEEEEPQAPATTEEPWSRVRKDLYRRQSNMEAQLNRVAGMVEGIARAKATQNGASPQPQANPVQDRLRFQQDPVGFLEELMERKAQQQEERVAQRVTQHSTEQQSKNDFYGTYPEMKDTGHPFYQEANSRYMEMVAEGHPEGYKTAMVAARLAAAESPQLREKNLRERRRSASDKTTAEVIANRGRVDIGAPKSKTRASDTSRITQEDHDIAKIWKVNLNDKDNAEWIRKEKARLQAQRYDRKSLDED